MANNKRPRPDGGFRDDFGPGGPGPGPGFGFDDAMGLGLGLPGALGNFNMDMDLGGLGLDFGAFPAVKLRGLPFAVNEGDVYAFLALDPIDIVMVRRNGRFSGEAFVLLSPGQVELALAKNRTYLGRRYVEVFPAKKLDYYKAIVAFMTDMDFGSAALGGGMGNPMGMGGDMGGMGGGLGGMAGSAPFPMSNPGFQGRGMMNGGRGFGGGKGGGSGRFGGGPTPEPPRAPPPDMIKRGGPRPPDGAPPGKGEGEGGKGVADRDSVPTGILKMRGLPFSAVVEDIVHWFNTGDLGIQPLSSDCVHLVVSYDNRPTGTAFVEFPNPLDASTAMSKDRQMLGNRYIELFKSSPEEVARSTGAM